MFGLLHFVLIAFTICATIAFTPSHVTPQKVTRWGTIPSESTVKLHAVIEKEAPLKTTGPAVLEPETEVDRPRTRNNRDRKQEREGNDSWEVRIFNDGLNTREHVARSLVQITGMSELNAYQTMMQAHQNGLAVVGRYAYEIAEMYNEALRKQGIVSDLVPVEEE
mmetsp:Transcript_14192/g.21654  ORF Transcript_14192/g.21654 Transcript_14192/m.21654 type:complete len:165 (+) Transcript_14192:149-643(+)|eukprot:CAMPEP_0178918646 /NCGR_PEP_ID=MMETSP0786-20121207/13941_1 /TAXON_ID=186022 /ORGANISM="Thalassionema frauenfeldii, Strain CCMP 1798" /LENGTH=164 /DNA_ID=CAMNT_0020592377 /DNA_START=122 /DNA_END=616 /DNA_ORIENTATION=+